MLTTIASSCIGGGTTPESGPSSAGPSLDFGQLRFTCGGRPFTSELLEQPPNAEQAAHPAAAALRAFLETPDAQGFLPRSGWLLAGMDDEGASFVAQVEGDPSFVEVEVDQQPGGWRVVGWGQCGPLAFFDNLNPATWMLDPDAPVPAPTDREFVVLVTETSCASGQSSEGRIVGPAVDYREREVIVVFAVRKLPNADAQECPGNPFTRLVVRLTEPLGERRLLDGGVFPPHDPTVPWPPP